MGYNSACVRDICLVFACTCMYMGFFDVGLSNAAHQILHQLSVVAITTRFETKWAIAQLSKGYLHIFASNWGFSWLGH